MTTTAQHSPEPEPTDVDHSTLVAAYRSRDGALLTAAATALRRAASLTGRR